MKRSAITLLTISSLALGIAAPAHAVDATETGPFMSGEAPKADVLNWQPDWDAFAAKPFAGYVKALESFNKDFARVTYLVGGDASASHVDLLVECFVPKEDVRNFPGPFQLDTPVYFSEGLTEDCKITLDAP